MHGRQCACVPSIMYTCTYRFIYPIHVSMRLSAKAIYWIHLPEAKMRACTEHVFLANSLLSTCPGYPRSGVRTYVFMGFTFLKLRRERIKSMNVGYYWMSDPVLADEFHWSWLQTSTCTPIPDSHGPTNPGRTHGSGVLVRMWKGYYIARVQSTSP